MTKKEARKQHSELQKEIKRLCKEIEPTEKKIRRLRKKQDEILITHQLFHSVSELKKYDGKDLSSITIYFLRDNSKEVEELFLCGDVLRVENGRLYYSDWENGILEYDKKEKIYIYSYFHFNQKYDIVGFDGLKLEKSDGENNNDND